MKTMSRERFFENDIQCAAVICIKEQKVFIQETAFQNKSGYCWDLPLYKNTDIVEIIKERSINEERPGSYKAPKKEITIDATNPTKDIFDYFTAALEMTAEEFTTFRQIAKDGIYLIAFPN